MALICLTVKLVIPLLSLKELSLDLSRVGTIRDHAYITSSRYGGEGVAQNMTVDGSDASGGAPKYHIML